MRARSARPALLALVPAAAAPANQARLADSENHRVLRIDPR